MTAGHVSLLRRLLRWRYALPVLFLLLAAAAFLHLHKPLPRGLSYSGPLRSLSAGDVQFLRDRTAWDPARGLRVYDHQIADAALRLIASARSFILVDLFLWNEFAGAETGAQPHRRLASELVEALIARKKAQPGMTILVLTDPVNTVYGGLDQPLFTRLEAAGIPVTLTHLRPLRDSNPLYSTFWRLLPAWFGRGQGNLLPNPLGEGRISLRAFLELLNFKANHRKVLLADGGSPHAPWQGLVTSWNPHDGSSAHSNVALLVRGPLVGDLLTAERAVLEMSSTAPLPPWPRPLLSSAPPGSTSPVQAQVLSEGAIRRHLLATLASAGPGDALDLAMFYFSDEGLLSALLAAHARGASLRVLLDPNKDAFGRAKNGIPNRQTAWRLHQAGIRVRWADTRGEQFHAKALLLRRAAGPSVLNLGSANWTRRNLHDFNLELNLALSGPPSTPALAQAAIWFEALWISPSPAGLSTSLPFETWRDPSTLKILLARFQEASGLSTF